MVTETIEVNVENGILDRGIKSLVSDWQSRGWSNGIAKLVFVDNIGGGRIDRYQIQLQKTNLGWSARGWLNGVIAYRLNGHWFADSDRVIDVMARMIDSDEWTGDDLLRAIRA